MKKVVSLLLALLLTLGVAAAAETVTYGSLLEEAMQFAAPVADGEFYMATPDEFDGKKVTSLADYAKTITQEEIDAVRAGNYTAAIVAHDASTDWGHGIVSAMELTLGNMGIEIIGISDASHDVQKSVELTESTIAMHPDVMIVAVQDDEAQKDSLQAAIDAGIKLVLYTGVAPDDFVINQDYYGCVLSDDYSMEYAGAKALCEKLTAGDQVMYISFGTWIPTGLARYKGFQDAVAEYGMEEILPCPNINNITQAADMAENYATAYPNMKGISGAWDEVCMAAQNTLNALGFECYTGGNGISENSLLSMLRGTGYQGSGAESSYIMGACLGALSVGALSGHENPELLMANTIVTTKETIPQVWQAAFGAPLPDNLQKVWDEWKAAQ